MTAESRASNTANCISRENIVTVPTGTVTVPASKAVDRADIATAVEEAGYTLVA